MNKEKARQLFDEADRLFKEEHYLEALQFLSEVDRAFPQTFNILFPMALCREKLGRLNEAYDLCVQMLEQFTEERRQERLQVLYSRLNRQLLHGTQNNANGSPHAAPGLLKDEPVSTPIDRSDTLFIGNIEVPWKTIIVSVALVAGLLLLLATVPVALNQLKVDEDGAVHPLNILLLMIVQFAFSCAVAYVALLVMGHLHHDDVLWNALDVCVAMLIFTALCFIPLVGWIIAYYKLSQHYEMTLTDVIVFVLLQVVFHLLFLYMLLPVIFGESAQQIIELI